MGNWDDDDDDAPVVFKRTNTPNNQSQRNLDLKNSTQSAEQWTGKALSQQVPNGENMYTRRIKDIPSSSAVTKSTSGNNMNKTSTPETSKNLFNKHHSFPNSSNAEAANSDSDDAKPLIYRKSAALPSHNADDSDNNDSLGLQRGSIIQGAPHSLQTENTSNARNLQTLPMNNNGTSKKLGSNIEEQKTSSKLLARSCSSDSDDDKPLHNKLKQNSSLKSKSEPGTSGKSITDLKTELPSIKCSYDSDDEKPLRSKIKHNSSSKNKSELGTSEKAITDLKRKHSVDGNPLLSSNKKMKLPQSTGGIKRESTVKEELKTFDVSSDKKKTSGTSITDTNKEPDFKKELKSLDGNDDDDDDVPISQRMKKKVSPKNESSMKKLLKKVNCTPLKKKSKDVKKGAKNNAKKFKKWSPSKADPRSGEGQKWTTLEHNGVIFPPPYKPHGVKMLYNGKPVDLTPEQEEVATMFAVMKDTEYATKKTFIENFMNDWRAILGKNHVIKKFDLCDFTPIYEWISKEKEKKKQVTAEEKKALKEEKARNEEKYMWAIVDGVKEKVGNFRVEPPGLFRGRGEHPKMGKLKKRIHPRDITINIGKNAPIPECPIPGERWKEVRHDNTVTWLAYWNDPINTKEFKYVFLAASSSLKGQSDKEKYEKARKLKDYIQSIRARYTRDFTAKDETKKQIAVATYLIDKLALRAGNEKDDDEADTVGCCTLKVEHVTLVPPNKLQFDFLGKDSIRYFNTVEVELAVYKAIGEFQKGGKDGTDDLFDKLDTAKLNAHLKELMPGLTAKVFRTYNASITLDEMLNRGSKDGTVQEKIAVYQSANKEVAIICNHQRSVSKNHDSQMSRLNEKIDELKLQHKELKEDLSRANKGKPPLKDADGKPKRNLAPEVIEKKLSQLEVKIEKMELDRRIKEDLKTVALGTSKINYLDPRISVAWCKREEVPIEKIFNKSLLAKFAWAMDVDPDFRF